MSLSEIFGISLVAIIGSILSFGCQCLGIERNNFEARFFKPKDPSRQFFSARLRTSPFMIKLGKTFMDTIKPQTATLEEAKLFDAVEWSEALK